MTLQIPSTRWPAGEAVPSPSPRVTGDGSFLARPPVRGADASPVPPATPRGTDSSPAPPATPRGTSSPTLRRSARGAALVATAAAVLAAPAVAHADSIAFTRASNVWLANPDGTGEYQVTRDGTTERPYRSPSQADDGTIAAAHGTEIVRMRQNGAVLNRMDPPPLVNSVSQPIDGAPVDVAISPDGARIAYTLVTVGCPIAGPGCDARPATAITPADRMAPQGNAYTSGSSWVTNARILTFGGFLHQVNTMDAGQQSEVHWWDDQELFGQGNSTDESDGEVNRQGTTVATIRGYGDKRSVLWLKVRGDVAAGSRAAGTLQTPDIDQGCLTGTTTDIAGPTWSPSGTSLAWREEGAIHVWADTTSCAGGSQAVIAGGAEPDWGPAAINPGPRADEPVPGPGPGPTPQPPGGGPGPSGPTPGGGTGPGGKARRTLKLAAPVKLGRALKRGFRVRVTGGKAGRRAFTATSGGKKVATGSATVTQAGAATATLRFTKAGRRRVGDRRSVTLKVTGGGVTGTITLKR